MPEKPKKSLDELHASVSVPDTQAGFFKKLWAFSGPGALIAVGYIDPGNWVTAIQGGAFYGYLLLFVILLSSLIAMLLQALCGKLGIVTGMDLAQATRVWAGPKYVLILWFVAELAIMATDLAEVIGTAIAFHLLFGIPLFWGVILTLLDTWLLFVLLSYGIRKLEAVVFILILTVFAIFAYEVFLAAPNTTSIIRGFLPNPTIFTAKLEGYDSALLIALGIVGATVMPHNLYLHSALVQSRNYVRSDRQHLREAIRFATWDSNLQLSFSFIINCLLLILGAALFFGHGVQQAGHFSALYASLQDENVVGHIASVTLSTLFAIALLASGQNSTITGTLTGQVVMQGFLQLNIPAWLQRSLTRTVAILPVLLCLYWWGDREDVLENLLVYSQVFLSLALPMSMIPLIYLTSSSKVMGEFVNSKPTQILAALFAALLLFLNLLLIIGLFTS
ncbi:Nramp family divalent metal transporter [Acinetobacter sp. MB5]|uniref:Nramp family divalent metal transporter n=1 Tax=Acinetobacter sp. MB5 TaxID=2069438 RepID=UPI000DD0483A|nr:Nramp family divalent metal transporter [Acinetobacter sp. MB5]